MKNINTYIDHLGTYGIILDHSATKILLISKSRGPFIGKWDLPGGRPEFFETFEETLAREILEETGLQLLQSKQITCELNIFQWGDVAFRHTGIIYDCKVAGDKIKTDADGHDSNGCAWFDLTHINNRINKDKFCPFVQKIALLRANK